LNPAFRKEGWKEVISMSCGKDHDKDDQKKADEELKKQQEWEKKNPGCSPTIDKECPHTHETSK
jgi:hypothetical protein